VVDATAAARTRTQRPRKHLAVHATELAFQPGLQILRRHRRPLLLRLEHAYRSALENHVRRTPRLGNPRSFNVRIGISRFVLARDLSFRAKHLFVAARIAWKGSAPLSRLPRFC